MVLDEADEMLNMGFVDSINDILSHVPEQREMLLFSATMPAEVAKIAKRFMNDPVEIVIGTRNEGAENVRHIYYMVNARDKYLALKRIADDNPNIYAIIFCRTRRDTQEIADNLIRDGYNADAPAEAQITGTDFAALSDEEAYKRVAVLKVMSRARPSDKQHEIGNRWKPAVEAGIDVEFMILSRLSVTAGAKYSLQGSKYKDFHIEGDENSGMVKLAQFSRYNTDLHYIQVPLMLHAYILKGFSIGAGIQFGSLVSAKESFNYMISDYNKQTNKTDKFYRFDRPSKTLVELAEGEDRFLKYSETVTDAYKGTDMTIPLSISYESEDVILDLRYNILLVY